MLRAARQSGTLRFPARPQRAPVIKRQHRDTPQLAAACTRRPVAARRRAGLAPPAAAVQEPAAAPAATATGTQAGAQPSTTGSSRGAVVQAPTRSRSPPAPSDGDEESWDNECPVFYDATTDEFIECMCCDYGFRTGVGRVVSGYGEIPKPAWQLAAANFTTEWGQLRRSFRYDQYKQFTELNPATGPLGKVAYALGASVVRLFSAIDEKLEDNRVFGALLPNPEGASAIDATTGSVSRECREIRDKLKALRLGNDDVWARERKRERAGGAVDTPWFVRVVYYSLCAFLDVAFNNRPLQRFWFLETVARMPYFSYQSMLHIYETLGWWRAGAELRKIHFAEEWNELHHLQIMEALGGDRLWVDRFMAQHAAVLYYVILCVLFVAAPRLAYNFSELIEAHAVDTYGEFADANEELLRTLPPPKIAVEYYRGEDLYYFDQFQTTPREQPRRPDCNTLYDVFINIRDDEGEHVATMAACQDATISTDLNALRGGGGGGAGQISVWDDE